MVPSAEMWVCSAPMTTDVTAMVAGACRGTRFKALCSARASAEMRKARRARATFFMIGSSADAVTRHHLKVRTHGKKGRNKRGYVHKERSAGPFVSRPCALTDRKCPEGGISSRGNRPPHCRPPRGDQESSRAALTALRYSDQGEDHPGRREPFSPRRLQESRQPVPSPGRISAGAYAAARIGGGGKADRAVARSR